MIAKAKGSLSVTNVINVFLFAMNYSKVDAKICFLGSKEIYYSLLTLLE